MHFNEHITQMWKILRQLASSPTGHGASSWVSLHFSPHIGTLAAMVAGLVSLDCDAPCAKEDPQSRGTWASGDSSPSRAFPRRGVRWLLTFAHFSRTVASGDSSPSCAFPCRDIRWLLTLARFLMQGHQVTPHLRAFMRWLLCTARAPYHLEWVRERSPLHTAATDEGLVSCEWESSVFQTRQPLMRGWYRVNKRAVSSRHGSHWWGAGIVWMIEETSDYVLHTAEHCSEAGGCMLRQWLFCVVSYP